MSNLIYIRKIVRMVKIRTYSFFIFIKYRITFSRQQRTDSYFIADIMCLNINSKLSKNQLKKLIDLYFIRYADEENLIRRILMFIDIRIARHFIYNTRPWNVFRLMGSYIYEIIIQKLIGTQGYCSYSNINTNPKKILIIYSKKHFKPNNFTRFIGNSASNLAKHVYESLININNNVTYIDQKESKVFTGMDLIIGIVSKAYIRNCKASPNAKKVLFLVNSHPIFRLRTLLKESFRTKIKLSPSEYASPFIFLKALLYSNILIIIGNEFVKKTFTDRRVDRSKINLINSGVNFEKIIPNPSLRSEKKIRFIYSPGYISLRKGILPLLSAWDSIDANLQNKIELIILGDTDNSAIIKQIKLRTDKRSDIKYFGFMDANSAEYTKLLQSCHSVIFPSLEEGQVGSVLEAMCAGCVPIISENCGIAIKDKVEGYIIKDIYDSREIHSYIEEIVYNKEKYEKSSHASRKYIETNHNWSQFKDNFIKALNS